MKKKLRKKTSPVSPLVPQTPPAPPQAANTANTIDGSSNWIPKEEVMEQLQVSVRTLFNWRKKGVIPFKTIGGKIYYNGKVIDQMLAGDGSKVA